MFCENCELMEIRIIHSNLRIFVIISWNELLRIEPIEML